MTNADDNGLCETRHGGAVVTTSGSPTLEVRIEGDVDLANAFDIEHRVGAAYDPSVDGVILDLGGTTYLDSAGLAMLVRITSRLTAARTPVNVIAPADSVARRVITLSGLATQLAMQEDPTPH
jgi:stage II sporulation protein AA (anti-sigma F factor antagonist)